jgi:SWI/SNF-related matrix-associated actin-dependent regulator of chromatin subfamily E protein 1
VPTKGFEDKNRQFLNIDSGTTVSHALEPGEDDGIDDSLSYRHISAARYHRNHRLINELFNEYVVPDTRAIITGQRMQQLKNQVQSLEKHQEKLQNELQSIEEKHETKKKKLIDSSAEFQREIKKVFLIFFLLNST